MQDRRLYSIWYNMRHRCNSPKSKSARWYYHKGIQVCDEWNNSFDTFQSWALSNGYAEDLTIDRIDPDGNYCPENCRWVTRSENAKYRNCHPGTPAKVGPYEVWRVYWGCWITVIETGLPYRAARFLANEADCAPEFQFVPGCSHMAARSKEPHNVGDRLYGFPGEFMQ